MGPLVTIADLADERVGDYRNLTDADLRRRQEVAAGMFLAEGVLVIRQLLASAYPVRSFLLTRAKLEELSGSIEAAGAAAPVYLVSAEAMAGITGFRFHRGAMASAHRVAAPAAKDLLQPPASLVVVAEGVNDHENLGALFRNAAAFGLDAVLLSPSCADPMYRRSVRVSMGHVLRVPWTWLAPWPAALGQLKTAGYRVVALTPDPATPPLEHVLDSGAAHDARLPTAAVAVLVGAEGPGLSVAALKAADVRARIPMAPGVDSLNVATAAAIAFHRLAERRA